MMFHNRIRNNLIAQRQVYRLSTTILSHCFGLLNPRDWKRFRFSVSPFPSYRYNYKDRIKKMKMDELQEDPAGF